MAVYLGFLSIAESLTRWNAHVSTLFSIFKPRRNEPSVSWQHDSLQSHTFSVPISENSIPQYKKLSVAEEKGHPTRRTQWYEIFVPLPSSKLIAFLIPGKYSGRRVIAIRIQPQAKLLA